MLFSQLPVLADQSASLLLGWEPSSDPDAVGYNIYYGTTSHSYNALVAVGDVTNMTIPALMPGETYYFAATTSDNEGNESGFSSESSYFVPEPSSATLASAACSGGQFSFTVVAGISGHSYVVQASTNLVDWVSVQTNTAPFVFTDPNAAAFSQRFYRALYPSP